jgi:hypothetical protein
MSLLLTGHATEVLSSQSLLTKRPEEQKLFCIAEDSLEFLEEAKIKNF